jgi:DDE superfamily endonuclease
MDCCQLPNQERFSCLALHPFAVLIFRRTSWSKRNNGNVVAALRLTFGSVLNWSSCCTNNRSSPMLPLALLSDFTPTRSASGDNVGPQGFLPCKTSSDEAVKPLFPPHDRAVIAAIACERVAQTQTPLSRQSISDITKKVCIELAKPISRTTVQRILDEHAIKPWQYEHWIFPRAPNFFTKAARVLDLYDGFWQDERLDPFDRVVSADEKTSIQARIRTHATVPPAPGRRRRVEHEYERGGALQYLAAWDIQEGRVMGRCEAKTGIEPFGRLVEQVMQRPEYRRAPRVFWVVDNGSSHRGEASVKRLLGWYANAILVHTPVHASWLNQVEIYFSLVQRKVLTPNDFANLQEVELRLRLYEELTNREPQPFNWKFTRNDLFELLQRLASKEPSSSR